MSAMILFGAVLYTFCFLTTLGSGLFLKLSMIGLEEFEKLPIWKIVLGSVFFPVTWTVIAIRVFSDELDRR